jgi:hypothetical protein
MRQGAQNTKLTGDGKMKTIEELTVELESLRRERHGLFERLDKSPWFNLDCAITALLNTVDELRRTRAVLEIIYPDDVVNTARWKELLQETLSLEMQIRRQS